jgi:sarcosine oxidase subunit beta
VTELAEQVDVVVIGGGVVGCSTAFHLAEAGKSVLLVEKSAIASGSSSKAAGGVRACFSDPLNVAIGKRSLELLADFAIRPGGEIDLHRVGYLFLCTTSAQLDEFGAAVEVHNSLGVRSSMISAEQAHQLSPLANVDDVIGACWSPDDGTCTPESVVQAYASGARRQGAVLLTNTEFVSADVRDGRVHSVEIRSADESARVRTSSVVIAAGAWSMSVGAAFGVDLPVVPVRREIIVTGPVPGADPELVSRSPMTIDAASTFYFHGEGRGVLAGFSDDSVEPGFDLTRDPSYLERLVELAAHRAPSLVDAEVTGGWAGLYEVSPDHDGIVGQSTSVEGLLYATGFSGHGFLQGPAIGEMLRDLVLGRPLDLDLSPMNADRFLDGHLRDERHLV